MSLSEDTNLHRDGNVWKDIICDEDYVEATRQWDLMTEEKRPVTVEYRTKKIWKSYDKASGIAIEGPTWLRATGFPELDSSGNIKTVMGWLIDISSQKWSEGVQAKRLDEALEAKQNANNFIDMTRYVVLSPVSVLNVSSADPTLAVMRCVIRFPLLSNQLTVFLMRSPRLLMVFTPKKVR